MEKKKLLFLFLMISVLCLFSCVSINNSELPQKKIFDFNYVYKAPINVEASGDLEITNYYRDDFDYVNIIGKTKPNIIIKINEDTFKANQNGYFKERINIQPKKSIIIRGLTENNIEIGRAKIEDYDAPNQPDGLDIVSVAENRIEIRWNENREEDLYGYNIYISTKDGGWQRVNRADEIITKTEYTISRLKTGTLYKIRVTAYDKLRNESQPSDEKTVTTLGEAANCCNH
ncbi:MAG TPA: fibronectin type III domain-containing protein [bacterium]|nr:fibronectin type III domain-containing protein [bacterium]